MDIVFCISDNYIKHCAISIASILENNKNNCTTFHIISNDITDKNKNLLIKMLEKYKQKIFFYHFDNRKISAWPCFKEKMPPHVTLQTYYRLFIPEILPSNINKVLYLDSDIIVLSDLLELWQTNITTYSVGVIAGQWTNYTEAANRLDYNNKEIYFNAGVILMNLKYLREINLTQKSIDFITNYQEKIIYHDQDVLNKLLVDSKLILPVKWNVCSFKKTDHIPTIYQSTIHDARKHPCIVHFFSPVKPWNPKSLHPFKSLYYFYSRFTPWSEKATFTISTYVKKILQQLNIMKSDYDI